MKKNQIQSIFGALALICMLGLPLSSVSIARGMERTEPEPSLCSWDPDALKCAEDFTGAGYCATYPPNCDGPIVTP